MARITFKGDNVNTCGELPAIGSTAPDFLLTRTDLSDVGLDDFADVDLVINVFPSIDTPVCAASVRRFNTAVAQREKCKVLCVSRDLPFAHSRFCAAEGIENVVPVSELRNRDFGDDYGLSIVDGPLAGLLARAVIIVDATGKVVYGELVPEISHEPDYEGALAALDALKNG